MTTIAIASTTAAANSSTITLVSNQTAHVYASVDLNVGETVTLQVTADAGATWLPVVDRVYRGVVLSDTNQSQMITGPGDFRLVKSATAVATAVYVDQ
jgi:hypothetical protein